MTYSLESSWAKRDRAIAHIHDLRAEVVLPENPHAHHIPIVCQYEADSHSIVCRVGKMSHWPLIVGDAIHNLRGALDHAWWQCASKKLGREPDECQARSIQFPIRTPGKNWDTASHVSRVGRNVVSIVAPHQPPKAWNWSGFHSLGTLNRLSNIDKHRTLPLLVRRIGSASTGDSRGKYVDCAPVPEPDRERDALRPRMERGPMEVLTVPAILGPGPEEGRPMFRSYVVVTGPNPRIEFKPDFTGEILLEGRWNVIDSLDRMGATVTQVLGDVEPHL